MYSYVRLVLTLLVTSTWKTVQASNVVEIEDNFDHWIGSGKSALVEFWAPWCDHCQQLEPIYEELGDAFAHLKDNLVIAKVNADIPFAQPLLEKYEIAGLPTIKWFGANGETDDYDPEASRTLEDLVAYIGKKSGLKPKTPKPPPSVTTQLTPDNFDRIVNDQTKDVLVAFTATWCEHCQKLKPIYDLVAWNFRSEEHVVIANLDGDADVDRAIAKKYNVKGYPILKLFPKGSVKIPLEYKSPRDEKSLVEFLNTYTGTLRAVGGGLNEKAGRFEALDEIVKPFVTATTSLRKKFYEHAMTLAADAGKSGKHYLRIMEKLLEGDDEFLTQEKTRLLKLMKKRSLAEDKLDELKIKYNILSTFLVNSAAQKIADGTRIERASEESAGVLVESVSERVAKAAETETKRVKEEL